MLGHIARQDNNTYLAWIPRDVLGCIGFFCGKLYSRENEILIERASGLVTSFREANLLKGVEIMYKISPELILYYGAFGHILRALRWVKLPRTKRIILETLNDLSIDVNGSTLFVNQGDIGNILNCERQVHAQYPSWSAAYEQRITTACYNIVGNIMMRREDFNYYQSQKFSQWIQDVLPSNPNLENKESLFFMLRKIIECDNGEWIDLNFVNEKIVPEIRAEEYFSGIAEGIRLLHQFMHHRQLEKESNDTLMAVIWSELDVNIISLFIDDDQLSKISEVCGDVINTFGCRVQYFMWYKHFVKHLSTIEQSEGADNFLWLMCTMIITDEGLCDTLITNHHIINLIRKALQHDPDWQYYAMTFLVNCLLIDTEQTFRLIVRNSWKPIIYGLRTSSDTEVSEMATECSELIASHLNGLTTKCVVTKGKGKAPKRWKKQ